MKFFFDEASLVKVQRSADSGLDSCQIFDYRRIVISIIRCRKPIIEQSLLIFCHWTRDLICIILTYAAHWVICRTLEIVLFVRPTTGHGGRHKVE